MSRDVSIYGGTKGPITLKQFVNEVNEIVNQLGISEATLNGLIIKAQPFIRDGVTSPNPYTDDELTQHFLVNARRNGEQFDIAAPESIGALRFGFYSDNEEWHADTIEEDVDDIVSEHPEQTDIDGAFKDHLKECLATRLEWSVDTFASRTHEAWILQNVIAVAIAKLTDGVINDDNGLLVDSRNEADIEAFIKA